MEDILSEPFGSLAAATDVAGDYQTATSYSEAIGPANRILVYLAYYDVDDADGDNNRFTGGEPDLIWAKVVIENSEQGFESLVSLY